MSSTNIHVILVEPEVEENIGFIARLMKNFSLEKLILLKPKVDIGSKAMVTAMHATDVLSGLETLGLDLADLRHDYSLIVGTTAKEGGTEDLLRRTIFPWEISKSISEIEDEVALVFGRESTGLTREELEVCDLLIRIPTSENYPSLNLSHAAAIIFYELFKSKSSRRVRLSTREERDRILKFFRSSLERIGYTGKKKERAIRVMSQLLGRSLLTKREAHVLTGVFRRIARGDDFASGRR